MDFKSKELLLEKLIEQTQEEKDNLESIASKEKSFANNNEMKQEGKYDTRKIEASYLAGAQIRRVKEIEIELNLLRNFPLKNFSKESEVQVGALIKCLRNDDEKICYYFLSPGSGGSKFTINDLEIQVVSKSSPIGINLLQSEIGDTFEVKVKNNKLEFEIDEIV